MNPGEYHFQNRETEKPKALGPIEPSFDVNPGILNNVINIGRAGWRKTVLFSGPTGGGKTALLNSLFGFSLLPEGCDQKIQVPTVIIRGDSFEVKALGRLGKPLSRIPVLKLSRSLMAKGFPSKEDSILKRLDRDDDIRAYRHRWETFWRPVKEAAETGRCYCVKATVPAGWLPKSIRLVDLPGFAGWFPDDSPALHNLHTTLMTSAAATIFVFKPEHLKMTHSLRYLGLQINNDRRVSLLVNEMDKFRPDQASEMQVRNGQPSFESAWRGYTKDVCNLLKSEYGWYPDNDPAALFFGASRLDRRLQDDWLRTKIMNELSRLYRTMKATFSIAGSNLRKKAPKI